MDRIFKLNIKITLLIFAFLDLFCVGMGMGVPIFNILFGFVVGWYIVRRVTLQEKNPEYIFNRTFKYAVITSLFTLVVMAILWGPTIKLLFTPGYDFKNFGIPLIFFEPKVSFIGWLVLMIFISPFLQLLSTIFAAYSTLMKWYKEDGRI
jgi:hypothetical protein